LTAEEEDSEARQQILDAEYRAQLRAAETRATTIAGLAAQLLFAFIVFGVRPMQAIRTIR
jgi:tetrahydromethanopterin S-methyltransferase subunit F